MGEDARVKSVKGFASTGTARCLSSQSLKNVFVWPLKALGDVKAVAPAAFTRSIRFCLLRGESRSSNITVSLLATSISAHGMIKVQMDGLRFHWGIRKSKGAQHRPHLDKVGRTTDSWGIRRAFLFERGYVASPLCRPSLASIATGLFPFDHGATGNDVFGYDNRAARDVAVQEAFHDHPSIIKTLVENGYLAHQSGKWWEGSWKDTWLHPRHDAW